MRRAAIWVLLLLAVGLAFFLLSQTRSEEGFYSPVYSPDGSQVFFIARETSGLVLGFGFECFSPPAYVFVWKDRFTLLRLRVEDGSVEIAETWPGSPFERQWLRTYRGRLFTVPSTRLQWDDQNRLQYRVRLRTPRQPTADHFFLNGEWRSTGEESPDSNTWQQGWTETSGDNESPLSGEWEVMPARGEQAYPCALVAHNAKTSELKVLLATPTCDRVYPNGIRFSDVAQFSRREQIERIRLLKSTKEELKRQALAEGLTEHEAWLRAIDQMQELGFYARPPQLVAQALSRQRARALEQQGALEPLFSITEMEFRVGLFQDIERAIKAPGTEVERSGRYVIHRDYSNSQKLNRFFESGGRLFYVETQRRTYRLKLTKERPATR